MNDGSVAQTPLPDYPPPERVAGRLIRLTHWVTRAKVLPDLDEVGDYTDNLRPPTFWEAWTGISNT